MSTPARIVRRPVPLGLPPLHTDPLAHRLLAARGITRREELELGLAALPSPGTLPDIDRAVSRLLAARDAGERVLIVGDYDCDGATSTAVAMLGLASLGFGDIDARQAAADRRKPDADAAGKAGAARQCEPARLDYLVPDRFRFGYGLSPAIVDHAVGEGGAPDLILTVDNGVASVEGVARARELGIDVVVTDHHLPPVRLPDAVAIVNPNLDGAAFPSRSLAGVGVLFYVLLAIRARLRERRDAADLVDAAGHRHDGADASLVELLDLVAIGTVADVVPFDRVNRTLVAQGIRRIRAGRTRPGVLALLKTAGREFARLAADDIGFGIGPRLNAAGRLADMRVGIECLLVEEVDVAHGLADELDALNRERRKIEDGMREEAELRLVTSEVASGASADKRFGIVLSDPGWHEGVIGILAGRLKERFHRPVVALTNADAGTLKGSARSIPGVHVRDVLQTIAARHSGLLINYGGHAMAAGVTLPAGRLDEFATAFDEEVRRVLGDRLPEREWRSDGELDAGDIDLKHARLIASLGPFGQGFEAPVFDGEFSVVESREVGSGHLKLVVEPVGGAPAPFDAIAFNRRDELQVGDHVLLVYRLDINVWRDSERLQLLVEHLERVEPSA